MRVRDLTRKLKFILLMHQKINLVSVLILFSLVLRLCARNFDRWHNMRFYSSETAFIWYKIWPTYLIILHFFFFYNKTIIKYEDTLDGGVIIFLNFVILVINTILYTYMFIKVECNTTFFFQHLKNKCFKFFFWDAFLICDNKHIKLKIK